MMLDDAVEVLKGFGDRFRLRLLALLAEHGTLCVCELERVLGAPQSTVSGQLGILRRLGLVVGRRDGVRINYQLRADLPPAVRRLVDDAVALVADDEDVRADREAARSCRACAPA